MILNTFCLSLCTTIVLIFLLCQVALLQGQNQQSCSLHTCHPPACRCPAHAIPGNLRPESVPQMILIAFDDAVNWENWQYYLRLFPPDGRRKNPNGCPISATFFVSHNFTDYCMVRKLHARGMEIGDHSVTHKLPRKWWTDVDKAAMAHEVLTQRQNLVEKAHIPVQDIHGWRSPFLQPAGDDLFSILYENNFTYDATMTYSFPKNLYSPVLWPFTLDFGYTLVCNIARCPQQRYPGLWIIPVVVVMDHREQKPCAYVDDCANMPRDKDEAYQMLWNNFLRNYRSNRAPLYLNLHSPWLNTKYQLDAMDEFIEKMVSMDDVYILTIHQALQWQMNPTPLDELDDFEPWQCKNFEPNAEDRKICKFTYKHRTAPGSGNNTGVFAQDMARSSHPTRDKYAWAKATKKPPRLNEHDESTSSRRSKHRLRPKDDHHHGDKHPDRHHEFETTHDHHVDVDEEPLTDEMYHESQIDDNHHRKHADLHEGDHDDHIPNIHHHHNHRAHKPWFLKGHATFLTVHFPLMLMLTLMTLCLFFP